MILGRLQVHKSVHNYAGDCAESVQARWHATTATTRVRGCALCVKTGKDTTYKTENLYFCTDTKEMSASSRNLLNILN